MDNILAAKNYSKGLRAKDPILAEVIEAMIRELEALRQKADVSLIAPSPIAEDIAFAATNFDIDTVGSWDVLESDINNLSYIKNGPLVTLLVDISGTSVTALANYLTLKVPNEIVPLINARNAVQTNDGATIETGYLEVIPNDPLIRIYFKQDATQWSIATASIKGQIQYTVRE